MWKKILKFMFLTLPTIAVVVIMIFSFQLEKKSYELEEKKVKEGQIAKKSLKVYSYGVSNIKSLFRIFANVDVGFNITLKGKELSNLYSVKYIISNNGDAPILKEDFSEKLKLSLR